MKLSYEAVDKAGRAVAEVIEAIDATDAMERLRRQGLFVAHIRPVTAKQMGSTTDRSGSRRPRAPLKQLTMFTRQLQVLMSTGTPLVQSLAALERQTNDPAWRGVIEEIRKSVEGGATLSDALEPQSAYFGSVYRSLVAAGESTGQLHVMLGRLAELTRQQLRLRSSVIGAMIYPCLLTFVALAMLGLMLGFIVPRFAGLYETLDAALPPSTQMLLTVSNVFKSYWWVVIGTLVGAGIGIKTWIGTESGRRSIDSFLVSAPYFGRLIRSFVTSRIARVLGVLIESHVPMLEALTLTRHSSGNVLYSELIATAEDAVTRGESISDVFADSPLISAYVTEAIRNGEQTGQIGPLLLSIADFLDEENDVVIKSLTSIMEPVILIVLGLLVGTIALCMFMPLFDLTSMTQAGGAP